MGLFLCVSVNGIIIYFPSFCNVYQILNISYFENNCIKICRYFSLLIIFKLITSLKAIFLTVRIVLIAEITTAAKRINLFLRYLVLTFLKNFNSLKDLKKHILNLDYNCFTNNIIRFCIFD